ncbi:MAG: hypothetical protein ACI87W_003440, partial [Halieaceae bacterium]
CTPRCVSDRILIAFVGGGAMLCSLSVHGKRKREAAWH